MGRIRWEAPFSKRRVRRYSNGVNMFSWKRCFLLETIFFQILSYIGLFLFFFVVKKLIPDIIIEAGDVICRVKKTLRKVIIKIKNS